MKLTQCVLQDRAVTNNMLTMSFSDKISKQNKEVIMNVRQVNYV